MSNFKRKIQTHYISHVCLLNAGASKIFTDKKHLVAGSDELYYFHYGYAQALKDVLERMGVNFHDGVELPMPIIDNADKDAE